MREQRSMRVEMWLPGVAAGLTAALALSGCFFGPTFEHDPGPGPSEDITASVAPDANTASDVRVTCDGPADQIAMLGSLCDYSSSSVSWNAHVGDQSISLGGADATLLVLGFHTQNLPDGEYDHTNDIRYAAYVVLDPPAAIDGNGWESERQTMRAWAQGEALSGEIVTQRAVATACGYDFVGSGTLVWRDTTLTIRWAAVVPC